MNLSTHLTYQDTSWRTLYEAQTACTLALEFYRGATKSLAFSFESANFVADHPVTTPLGDVVEQGLSIEAFYDQGASPSGTDFGSRRPIRDGVNRGERRRSHPIIDRYGRSRENVQAVVKELERLRVGANDVAKTYDLMARAGEGYVVTTHHLETAEDELVKKALELTAAQRAMNQVLEETATSVVDAGAAATGAVGTKGAHGQGVMGLSYAFQDFTSVISQGGANALPRAMMSVSNNIDSIGRMAGLSVTQVAGLSVGFTASSLAMPLLIDCSSGFRGRSGLRRRTSRRPRSGPRSSRAEIKKTDDAYKKMIGAPTEAEKESAERIKMADGGPAGRREGHRGRRRGLRTRRPSG